MCGIVGWIRLQPGGEPQEDELRLGVESLEQRGPDARGLTLLQGVGLGHCRLSILDTTSAANQPMQDPSGRYTLVYNGEIYNFRELGAQLSLAGVELQTESDTEVLLHWLIRHGRQGLAHLNGFYAFALHDAQSGRTWLARDRFGIKPLLLYQDAGRLLFASEMKALLAMGIPRQLNTDSLWCYTRLNYLPPNRSMLLGVRPLEPGEWVEVSQGQVSFGRHYTFPPLPEVNGPQDAPDYRAAQQMLRDLMANAVRERLVADVPLGVFLSGGIDSSVIATLAADYKPELQTFAIRFDDPLYDESRYAQLVAERIGSRHTVFTLTYEELYAHLQDVLNYLDEPFADASALNVYLLSKKTRQHVTVALSGDGADELFGGYSKHQAEARARAGGGLNSLLKLGGPLLNGLPAPRNTGWGRKLWQIQKFVQGLGADQQERYWAWCSVLPPHQQQEVLRHPPAPRTQQHLKTPYTRPAQHGDMNGVLQADLQLVLPGDMLRKVDSMSMANSLEVRTPFLDHRVVEFAQQLPAAYKVTPRGRKRILQDAFRPRLPAELYNRPKQGFEVPLAGWFRGPLKSYLEQEVVNRDLLQAQGLFDPEAVQTLHSRVQAGTSGKEDWTLWALVVFQHWYKRVIAP